MDMILEVTMDAAKDNIKLLPFLFLTYPAMEYLEKKMGEKTHNIIESSGKAGPLFGGILGMFPQCGFSAAASNLYAGGVITAGTLLAVYLSTSDEMIPIFISEAVSWKVILRVLFAKVLFAVITGFLVDLAFRFIPALRKKHKDIHGLCEQEHCHCEEGILKSAVKHTLKIFLFLFLISLGIGFLIEGIGRESLAAFLAGQPAAGQFLAGLVGLIPNCAASVLITQLYLTGVLSTGAMMSGLLVGAGVGLLVLFRMNKSLKENISIVAILYIMGVLWGLLLELLGVNFLAV